MGATPTEVVFWAEDFCTLVFSPVMSNAVSLGADGTEADCVVWQQRLARWQVFQPTTRNCLERVTAVGGETLAEQLAEAIRRDRERESWPADRRGRS
jgi:hypothetical protein